MSGDFSASWRAAQRLLHSKHKAAYDDAESAKLDTTFCPFCRQSQPYPRRHLSGITVICVCSPTASRASAVIVSASDDTRNQEAILSTIPSKLSVLSPLDALPRSLLKSCSLFRSICTDRCQTCQPVAAYRKVPGRYKRAQVLPLLKKNRTRQLIAGELQTNFQSGNRLQGHRETCADSSVTTSARFNQLQRVLNLLIGRDILQ